MANMRRILRNLILLGLLLGLIMPGLDAHALAADKTGNQVLRLNQDIPESYQLVAENTTFQLYASQETLAFKVVDKRSGYVWNSNLDEVTKDDRLNKTWTAFARSGISIDFLDTKAVPKRNSITNADHTIDFKLVDNGFEALLTFTEPSITLKLIVTLNTEGVNVEIPFESIKEENPDFRLGLIHVYPFFAAVKEDSIPGYMFIPDGSGTLIKFAASTKAKKMFYGKYYGDDLGMIEEMPYDYSINPAFEMSIPVIGMVHEEKKNAYIAVIEKGASYGEIQGHPAGIITKFNFIYNTFIYNESYFQKTNRSGAGVTAIQANPNSFDIKIHYRFLTGEDADYVGMAKSYQKYLIDQGLLNKVEDANKDIGIRLEFLGAEKEKILLWYRSIPMTTVDQMEKILDDLGMQNVEVVYYGWQPYGASSMPPTTLSLDGSLGNLDQLKKLVDKIIGSGGNFSLYYDPQAALVNDESAYNARNDLAMSITKVNLIGFNDNKVNYYLNYDTVSRRYTSLTSEIFSRLGSGVALDQIGSMLYSDFKAENFLDREDAATKYQALAGSTAGRRAFYMPNEYMFGLMSAYFDMPITDSRYIYTTEVVPFLEIVFAGYIPMYAPVLNFSSDLEEDLLRQVDFGVYPSYFLSQEVTAKILNTESNWIYSSSYDQWGDEVKSTYQWLNALLAPVKGQAVVARERLAEGVSATTYANGYQIIVNYNSVPYQDGNLVVNARDAMIREVQP